MEDRLHDNGSKLLNVLNRELWQRRIPHGMISWRYLSTDSPEIMAHRQMFWNALPRLPKPLYLALELILWAKWAGLFGWLALFRTLHLYGGPLRDARGISKSRQFRTLVRISIGACMPPGDAYRFGLLEHPEKLWNYVSDRHISSFHRWRNNRQGLLPEKVALLANKAATTDLLISSGIPMAPILATASKTENFDFLATLKKHRRLFCKTRAGNRGLGAFECWYNGQAIEGRMFEGDPLPNKDAVMQAWESLLQRDHGLVQPALQNHPQLAHLVPDGRAITVRCITHRSGQGIAILCSSLEIPDERKATGKHESYIILSVEADSGLIKSLPGSALQLAEIRQRQHDMIANINDRQPLPDWDALIHHSLSAHEQFPDFWAIAWDWVLTPEGPVLLEGNNGFGGSTPQILTDGFLKNP